MQNRKTSIKVITLILIFNFMKSSCITEALPATVFPLKLDTDENLLVDQNNTPFLINGDTPWSLLVKLSEAEVEKYLEIVSRRGLMLLLSS